MTLHAQRRRDRPSGRHQTSRNASPNLLSELSEPRTRHSEPRLVDPGRPVLGPAALATVRALDEAYEQVPSLPRCPSPLIVHLADGTVECLGHCADPYQVRHAAFDVDPCTLAARLPLAHRCENCPSPQTERR